jgi:hypothetical protein
LRLCSLGNRAEKETLDAERLIIANGETPSLFLPRPWSSDPLTQAVRRFHRGADA